MDTGTIAGSGSRNDGGRSQYSTRPCKNRDLAQNKSSFADLLVLAPNGRGFGKQILVASAGRHSPADKREREQTLCAREGWDLSFRALQTQTETACAQDDQCSRQQETRPFTHCITPGALLAHLHNQWALPRVDAPVFQNILSKSSFS